MEKSTIGQRAYRAFKFAERPIGKGIAPHECIECDDIAKSFGAFDVQSVPDSMCEWLARSLPLLSPAATCYYLPRLIEFGSLNPQSNVNSDVVSFMSDTRDGNYSQYALKPEYSDAARASLVEYFEFLRGLNDPDLDQTDISKAISFWRVEA